MAKKRKNLGTWAQPFSTDLTAQEKAELKATWSVTARPRAVKKETVKDSSLWRLDWLSEEEFEVKRTTWQDTWKETWFRLWDEEPWFIPGDFTEAEKIKRSEVRSIWQDIFDDEDFTSPTTASERAEDLLRKQEAETKRQEESIRLQQEWRQLQETITTDKLERTEAWAEWRFLPWREWLVASANIAAAEWFATWVKRELSVIDNKNKQIDFKIESLQEDLQKAQASQKQSLAKNISEEINIFNKQKAELAREQAETLKKWEDATTQRIVDSLSDTAWFMTDEQLFNAVVWQGWTSRDYATLKSIWQWQSAKLRSESPFWVSKAVAERQQQFQDVAFFPMMSSWAFNDLSNPDTLASLASFSNKAWFSMETAVAMATAQAEWNLQLSGSLKSASLTANQKNMNALQERLNSTSVEALEQNKLLDPNKNNDAAYDARISQIKAWWDLDVVTKASNVPVWQTYNPGNKKDPAVWECWRFVNEITWIPWLMGDSLESKKSRINSQTPVPWAAFISNLNQTNAEFWHTWIVESVNANWTINVVESNLSQDSNWVWIVSRRTIDPLVDTSIEGYYVKPALVQTSQRIDDIIWVATEVFWSRVSDWEREAVSLVFDQYPWATRDEVTQKMRWFKFENEEDAKFWNTLLNKIRTFVPLSDLDLPTIASQINQWLKWQAVRSAERQVYDKTPADERVNEFTVAKAITNVNKLNELIKVASENTDIWPMEWTFQSWLWRFKDTDAAAMQLEIVNLVAQMRNQLSWTAVTETESAFLEPLIPELFDRADTFTNKVTWLKEIPTRELNVFRNSKWLPSITENQVWSISFEDRVWLYWDKPIQDTDFDDLFWDSDEDILNQLFND